MSSASDGGVSSVAESEDGASSSAISTAGKGGPKTKKKVLKKKSKDKRKQQKYIEGDKECEDCGTSSSVDDPLRTLAIAEGRASEGMIPLIWGRARKVTRTSFILPGKKCYYCNRTRRSKAMYRKMPKNNSKHLYPLRKPRRSGRRTAASRS